MHSLGADELSRRQHERRRSQLPSVEVLQERLREHSAAALDRRQLFRSCAESLEAAGDASAGNLDPYG
jgi:hypothetical protein